MYTSARNLPAAARNSRPGGTRPVGRIGSTVVLLGFVSLLTDVSQEMVTAILPLYLTVQLGIGVIAFGMIDGLYSGATALVRLLGGVIADRGGRYKQVAFVGYGISAVCKGGLALVSGAWGLTVFLLIDRIGKGIRTAPRDAMISLTSDSAVLGRAFGVHRSLDTCGALLGPLVAFALLAELPHGYRTIFVVSTAIAIVGLALLGLFVRNPERKAPAVAADEPARERLALREALDFLRIPRFRAITLVAGLVGLFTISDAFVYLVLQRNATIDFRWFPLLYLGTAVTYLLLAVPIGRLADSRGRARVFVGGYVVLLLVYVLLLVGNPGTGVVIACLALLGLYYAATDGVLMALASAHIPEPSRTSGLAVVTTATAASRFLSSVMFGVMWSVFAPAGAVRAFVIGLCVAVPLSAFVLRRNRASVLA